MTFRSIFLYSCTGILMFFASLNPEKACAQTYDDFSDHDLSKNPTWSGKTTRFSINSQSQLQLNGINASDTAWISTPSALSTEAEWNLWLKMGFAASSSNYLRIYLISDSMNLSGPLNGYYLRIGETGNLDGIDLYRQEGIKSFKILDGLPGRMASSGSQARIKVTRDGTGNWEIYSDTTGGKRYTFEGTCFDNAFSNASYTGIWCKYTSSNKNKFWFDDFESSISKADTLPPTLDSIAIPDSTHLDLYFNEELDTSMFQDIKTFWVDGQIGNPLKIIPNLRDLSMLGMDLGKALIPGITYNLLLNRCEDKRHNISNTPFLKSFTYIPQRKALPGDLVINEIMADPTPTKGLPSTEYVEIYNRSPFRIPLSNLFLSDGSTKVSLKQGFINSGEYLLLFPGPDSLFKGIQTMSLGGFPSLNNTGDLVEIMDDSSTVIDSIRYADSWYSPDKKEGGYSLERINPEKNTCRISANWTASKDTLGGSPGLKNSCYSIKEDSSKVMLTGQKNIPHCILGTFSEPVISDSLKISINKGTAVPDSIKLSEEKILIYFNYKNGDSLFIQGLSKCENKRFHLALEYRAGEKPAKGDLVINEFMCDPDPSHGSASAEFVEIYNVSQKTLELGGLLLGDKDSYGRLDSAILKPGELMVLCSASNSQLFDKEIKTLVSNGFPSLNNDGDQIRLALPDSSILDQVHYDNTWLSDPMKKDGGYSFERIDPLFTCFDKGNWKFSNDKSGSTAGKANTIKGNFQQEKPFSITSWKLRKKVFYLELNHSAYSPDISTLLKNNPEFEKIIWQEQQLQWILKDTLKVSETHTLIIKGLSDCSGNPVSPETITYGRGKDPSGQELLINEIMFNPPSYGADYVELYNNSGEMLSLDKILLKNLTKNDAPVHVADTGFVLMPHDYYVLTPDPEWVKKNYACRGKEKIHLIKLPGLDDKYGDPVLLTETDTGFYTLESMHYSQEMQFPLLKDFQGVSLERISPSLPGGDTTTWCSASGSAGYGTPGYRNSQFRIDQNPADTWFSLSSEMLSPDNDGYQDEISINYKLDNPSGLGRVRIFNDNGQLVKTILSNQSLGIEGSLIWNGLSENNTRLMDGIYFVQFELQEQNGNFRTGKKAFVITSR